MSISNLVREARRRVGFTQTELAERAGVPKSSIGRAESRARTPSIKWLERLVRASGLNVV
jgi:transcriptional regulator with XRE-family HTH domain